MNITPVSLSIKSAVGIVSIDYPPVNALSQSVRLGIVECLERCESDDSIQAIIIRCTERTFIAGADIKEFGQAPLEPHLPDVVNRIAACSKPVVASLFGTSLGGGFEVALACHYRVASSGAKIGLPEVNLGLIPGAGGTQRLPRVVGCSKAIEMITSGRHYPIESFEQYKLIDHIVETPSDLDSETLKFAIGLAKEQENSNSSLSTKMIDNVDDWDLAIAQVTKKARGKLAPVVAAELIKRTRDLSVLDGMRIERAEFVKLKSSEQSAALRFSFAAERTATKTNFKAEPLNINRVGIIGAGTMGSGIATVFLTCGYEVILIEQSDDALSVGKSRIEKNFASNLKRGRMTQKQVLNNLGCLQTSTDYNSLSDCDLVIEAVFEKMSIKEEIFTKLDKVCKPECILATNTSYLDINQIAASVSRPEQVIGMHFFSPANIMKLLEIVQAEESSEQALVTAMNIAKKLKKVPVLVGVCFGFAGNRMYTRYGREVQQMLLEGARVDQIDSALTNWGMAMGPLAVADMSGIDIGVYARRSQPFPENDPGFFKPSELMFKKERFGQKAGRGYYRYDEDGKAIIDESVNNEIRRLAEELGVKQRTFDEFEIVNRCLFALINEGCQLLSDGIVQRASDIDVIWQYGYGFPRHKGGPMFQATNIGNAAVEKHFEEYRSQFGKSIWPNVDLAKIVL